MISHALSIVTKELSTHLKSVYSNASEVFIGNIACGIGTAVDKGQVPEKVINFSIVNIKEEKSLKNLPHYVRNDVTQTASYQNPPVFLNFQILITVTHTDYTNALLALSRVIRFFQFKNVFTQDNVAPNSLTVNPLIVTDQDQLSIFKLIFDLYSPTMEEINHLWGTLGGKQYPFVLYTMRMLDLQFKAIQSETGLITEIVSDFHHKKSVANL
jgi:hypothetical protein